MKQGKNFWAGLLAGVLCLSLAACGASSMTANGGAAADFEMKEKYSYTADAAEPGAVFDGVAEQTIDQSSSNSSVYRDSAVKLIRRASLTVQTTEFDKAVAALETLVMELGGYYENAELRSGSYYNQNSSRSGNYTIRIPADKYDAFISQVDGIGYLARKNESSEDVGEAYHDIEARLKTQRTKQERLLELLKKAQSMEDIIALESALSDVEYHIEQYTSDLNRYDGLVSFATIHLSLDEMVKIVDEPGEKAGLLTRMKAGVVSSADALVTGVQDVLIWASYNLFGLLVFAVAVSAGVVFGRKYVKIRKSEKKIKAGQEPKAE